VKVGAVVLLLVAAVWLWQHQKHAALEHRLSTVATALAGRPVHVHCQGLIASLIDVYDRTGEVRFDASGRPADSTFLTRGTCGELSKFLSDPSLARARAAAGAITTLTHESMHLRGWQGEADAQCYALQEDAYTVVELGGTPQEGELVAAIALARQPELPTEYQSSDCRAGGRLDLHPDTPAFPAEDPPEPLPAGLVGPGLGGPQPG
jgi:hypothetical protein